MVPHNTTLIKTPSYDVPHAGEIGTHTTRLDKRTEPMKLKHETLSIQTVQQYYSTTH